MLSVRDLRRSYDGLQAVADLSFDVAPGEILGLVGPNGAGKTTTLRALRGILKPDAGRIVLGGKDLRREGAAAKRLLSFVPDTPHPFEALTVREHLTFIALAYGVPPDAARSDGLLRELDLLEKRDALAVTLSRGMQQKLALACVFLHDPRVILLAEPLTGLDPRGIRIVRDSIVRRAAGGAAVLISSHLLDLVERLCHRVLILHRGRCIALGTLDEIRASAAVTGEADLEEIFFKVTEEAPGTP